ncbi:MAG: hypothetical protein IH624_03720, partial [Phycisphaerae bacterium]|nr:hypothetical protein [Phycisphaerae bacterium]
MKMLLAVLFGVGRIMRVMVRLEQRPGRVRNYQRTTRRNDRSDPYILRLALMVLFSSAAHAQEAPYPPSPVIADMSLDWSTHQREALGSDNWQLTWADDDHQYGAWG